MREHVNIYIFQM